jgi:hypothetical protein
MRDSLPHHHCHLQTARNHFLQPLQVADLGNSQGMNRRSLADGSVTALLMHTFPHI